MKNIMIFDDGQDYFFDVHSVSEDDFSRIFTGPDQNVEFHDDLYVRSDFTELDAVFRRMWYNRRRNANVKGIHGMLFYENWDRKPFYPGKHDIADTCVTISAPSDGTDKTILVINRKPSEPIVASCIDIDTFNRLFSLPQQDVVFFEDIVDHPQMRKAEDIIVDLKKRIISKSNIVGIDGVFYIGYPERRIYFPTRIDGDIPRHYPLQD